MYRDRLAFHAGISNYVPAMQYASEMVHSQPTAFSLGSPAVSSDTAVTASVAANAAANTVVSQSYTSDARYGRNLILTVSGNPGNSNVIEVQGVDYLGQPMCERFTGASGATAILYGKKAFYKVNATKVITPSSNAVTYKVGTGSRLGLPFKGDVAWAKEGGVLIDVRKRDIVLSSQRSSADAVAGNSTWFRSPCAGFIKNVFGFPNGGGSTNDPVVTVKLGGVAITGLTVTIDSSDVTGAYVTDEPTTPGYSANNRLVAGTMIEVVAAAAASAKGDTVGVTITPTHVSLPDLTDPATTTTGDPRGSYESISTLDGATEIIVGLIGDNAVNASGNGGLHGIKHYFA